MKYETILDISIADVLGVQFRLVGDGADDIAGIDGAFVGPVGRDSIRRVWLHRLKEYGLMRMHAPT